MSQNSRNLELNILVSKSLKQSIWSYIPRRSKIFSLLNRARDRLSSYRKNFRDYGTPWEGGPPPKISESP